MDEEILLMAQIGAGMNKISKSIIDSNDTLNGSGTNKLINNLNNIKSNKQINKNDSQLNRNFVNNVNPYDQNLFITEQSETHNNPQTPFYKQDQVIYDDKQMLFDFFEKNPIVLKTADNIETVNSKIIKLISTLEETNKLLKSVINYQIKPDGE